MKFDAGIPPTSLTEISALVQNAEDIGFDGLWSSETQRDPFLPLALAAEHSDRMTLGTAVAIGFARSPATLAYSAWDLAQASQGRFILGLGTQVRAHIERRFGMSWPDSPVGKLREMIEAIRALWSTWQTGERLNYRGDYYKLTLMSPFFDAGRSEYPDIPIFIAGVNTGLCRLAGEAADGFVAHPYHSERYLREVVRPAIAEGAKDAGRDADQVQIYVSALVATDEAERDFIRSQIAFYASTPSYRPVMELHGWGEVADQLRDLSRKQDWSGMVELVTDEMMETYAVIASPEDLAQKVKSRYSGLVDRLSLYLPYSPGQQDEMWRKLVTEMQDA
jgi:probable F420-dependent oxidoreductase